ncbi:uncharacterized protein BDZ99DRAFT_504286 [Mytilinidion resinicola]|uniref:Uncharacterized protein n=1 Tax=Mytilinidion resinicola TaxID=574789 RepID=A0A6A6Y1V3_9PEZI|nr:uncharacterized protein BDZ99DRAFT_504286 [Mytilinidion resinicola]KAF2801787.1 hypothetical protein BDZ99DRAFT_504286 [Mytilinidion resinicola]
MWLGSRSSRTLRYRNPSADEQGLTMQVGSHEFWSGSRICRSVIRVFEMQQSTPASQHHRTLQPLRWSQAVLGWQRTLTVAIIAFVVGDFMWLLTDVEVLGSLITPSYRRRRLLLSSPPPSRLSSPPPSPVSSSPPSPSLIAAAVPSLIAAAVRLIAAAVRRLIAAAAVPLLMTREATFVRWCRGSRELDIAT